MSQIITKNENDILKIDNVTKLNVKNDSQFLQQEIIDESGRYLHIKYE